MTINFDQSTKATSALSTTLSFSHTVGAGINRILIVGSASAGNAGDTPIAGITFNGIALTKALSSGTGLRVEEWYLEDPPVGTFTVAITYTDATTRNFAVAASFTGVDLANPIENTGSNSGGPATNSSVSVTTIAVDAFFVDMTTHGGNSDMTEGGSQTLIEKDRASPLSYGMSYQKVNTPGATAHTWTWSGGEFWQAIGISLKPAKIGSYGVVI